MLRLKNFSDEQGSKTAGQDILSIIKEPEDFKNQEEK
jgi:hypothetical protein